MLRVTNTWFNEELAKKLFYTGLVYELEDGTYFVTTQDGYLTPGAIMTAEELKAAEGKS